jgi:hypothetical protein
MVLAAGASAQVAEGTFPANLSLGSRGSQVVLLQQTLNRDRDTRVAESGPGSPGNETDYFGVLTKDAVVRFQEKYSSDVLAPVGLARGSGYVGFYTRAKLNTPANSEPALGSDISLAPPPVAPISPPYAPAFPSGAPAASYPNPNFENLDKFLAAVYRVGAEQGLSLAELSVIKKHITDRVATTTDMRAAFLDIVRGKSAQPAGETSFLGRTLAAIGQAFEKVFVPERARAATGAPFGGALLSAFFCEDSATWLITISPLPPSFATLLTYAPGSQAYLSYNIPATSWLLGDYEPGSGVCIVACPFCVYIPSGGMIAPVVGSSPI